MEKMTELERKALLGDIQAQKLCTEKGIAIACPLCGKKPGPIRSISQEIQEKMNLKPYAVCCGGEDCRSYVMGNTPQEALANWNTRPAPPIGRCEECDNWDIQHCSGNRKYGTFVCPCTEWSDYESSALVYTKEDGWCNHFEPKGDEENE